MTTRQDGTKSKNNGTKNTNNMTNNITIVEPLAPPAVWI